MKKKAGWRSVQWFGRQDIYGFIYRSWVRTAACRRTSSTAGRSSASAHLVRAHALQHALSRLAEHVRNGILEAGGFPLEFP